MKRIFSLVIALLLTTLGLQAQTAPDATELTRLLKEFLAGASRNDAATHDRFWAEELIYTGSGGRRRVKADVLHDVRSAPAPKPDDPKTVYSAEDIRIQQHGDFAVVAFRLVGTTERGGKTEMSNFLNTGTFLKRNGKWQVVAWQATKLPKSEEETKKEVAATEAAFHQAMLSSDGKKLGSVTDDSFIWTQSTGEQMTRQQLLDEIGSGRLKYAKLETNDVKVWVYGDAGVVRGVSPRQRSSTPKTPGTGDAAPFTGLYTLTFVNKDGAWKAVAMHTSRQQ